MMIGGLLLDRAGATVLAGAMATDPADGAALTLGAADAEAPAGAEAAGCVAAGVGEDCTAGRLAAPGAGSGSGAPPPDNRGAGSGAAAPALAMAGAAARRPKDTMAIAAPPVGAIIATRERPALDFRATPRRGGSISRAQNGNLQFPISRSARYASSDISAICRRSITSRASPAVNRRETTTFRSDRS
jgi:hypothetical protein